MNDSFIQMLLKCPTIPGGLFLACTVVRQVKVVTTDTVASSDDIIESLEQQEIEKINLN